MGTMTPVDDYNFNQKDQQINIKDLYDLVSTGRLSALGLRATFDKVYVSPYAKALALDAAPLPFVNVKDFGATGDGVTDNLSAFEDALNALGTAGGHLTIPAGHYYLSDSINIDCEWIIVSCDADTLIETTNTVTSSGGHAIAFIGYVGLGTATTPQREYAEWNNGRITTNIAGTNENALGVVRYKRVRVNNLTVPVAGRKAFTAQYGVDDIVVDNTWIGQTGNSAISIEESCNRVSIRKTYVQNAGRAAVNLSNVNYIDIDDLYVETCLDGAVIVNGCGNVSANDIVLLAATGGHGIYFNTVTGFCSITNYDISGIATGYRAITALSGTGRFLAAHGKTSGTPSIAISGASWTKVELEDIEANSVPAGTDMYEFASLTTPPRMKSLTGIGTAHRYTVTASSMNGFEPVVSNCKLPTGTGAKYNGWKPKLEVIASALTITSTKDFPSIAANTTAEMTFTITGAVLGDHVIAQPTTAGLETGLVWSAYVSAADTVSLRIANVTTSAIDPASRQWKVTVLTPS